jgi:hypothetical protein
MNDQDAVDKYVAELLRHRSADALVPPGTNAHGGQVPLNNPNPSGSLAGGAVPLPSSSWPPMQQGDADVVDLTGDYIAPQPQQAHQNYAAPPSLPQPGHLQHPRQHSAAPGYLAFPPAPQYQQQQQQQQQQQYVGPPATSLFGGDPAAALQAAIARTLPSSRPAPAPGQQQQQQQYLPSASTFSREQAMQHILNANPMLLAQHSSGPLQNNNTGGAGGGGFLGGGWNASQMLQQQRDTGQGGTGLPSVNLPPSTTLSSRIITSGSGLQQQQHAQQQHAQAAQAAYMQNLKNYQAIAPLLGRNFHEQQLIQQLQQFPPVPGQMPAASLASRYAGSNANYQGPYRPTSLQPSFQQQQQQQYSTRNSAEAMKAAIAALQTVGIEGEMQPPGVSIFLDYLFYFLQASHRFYNFLSFFSNPFPGSSTLYSRNIC